MWNDPPDYDQVQEALLNRAQIKAELRVVELDLDILQAEMAKAAPRNTAVKLIGVDEASRTKLFELRTQINMLKERLDGVEATLDFFQYHKDMYKAIAYKGSL